MVVNEGTMCTEARQYRAVDSVALISQADFVISQAGIFLWVGGLFIDTRSTLPNRIEGLRALLDDYPKRPPSSQNLLQLMAVARSESLHIIIAEKITDIVNRVVASLMFAPRKSISCTR